MDENIKKKLNKVLSANKTWPIILEGVNAEEFTKATIVPATLPSSQLGVINDINGLVKPGWVVAVEENANSKTNLLVISAIDKIEKSEQRKFRNLLDSKSLNGYKLPDNLQIALTIDLGNRAKLDDELLSLTIYYKAE